MNDLIKINDDGLVSARDLYDFLEITERFNSWFERYCKYGFEEDLDYTSVKTFTVVNNGAKREIDDYAMTVEMAKEFSMLQKTKKGSQARKYFIQVEKYWNSPEMIMKRALEIANKKVAELQAKNDHQSEVIKGFTDNITTADKRAILNRVVKKGGKYQERYNLLYKEFKDKYHIDLKKRYKNYNLKHTPKYKSVLAYADEELKCIDKLYEVACKLFESDVNELIEEMFGVINDK